MMPQLKIPYMKFKKYKNLFATSLLVIRIWKYYSPKERITNFQERNLTLTPPSKSVYGSPFFDAKRFQALN